jgi:response regulator of citrate/malate metabolism
VNDNYTLLVIEDDPNHQLLIKRILAKKKSVFSVVEIAQDIREAKRLVNHMKFDCYLVDNQLPEGQGLDFITTLQAEGVEGPFVLMTSAGNEELVVQAFRKKVSDYVVKDVGFWKDLPALLLRVMETSTSNRASETRLEELQRTNAGLDEVNTEVQMRFEELRCNRNDTRELIASAVEEIGTLLRKKPAEALKEQLKKIQATLVEAASHSRQPND